jgi:hypothetical protein
LAGWLEAVLSGGAGSLPLDSRSITRRHSTETAAIGRMDMENLDTSLPADAAGLLDLGVVLGESMTFGLVAGRTAAARAACLHRLREEKLYRRLEEN